MSKPASLKEAPLSSRISTHGDRRQGLDTSLSNSSESKDDVLPPVWKPSVRLYVAFLTLAVITLMVALYGTSLSVALPNEIKKKLLAYPALASKAIEYSKASTTLMQITKTLDGRAGSK